MSLKDLEKALSFESKKFADAKASNKGVERKNTRITKPQKGIRVTMSVRRSHSHPVEKWSCVVNTISELETDCEARKLARKEKLIPWFILDRERV